MYYHPITIQYYYTVLLNFETLNKRENIVSEFDT